MATLPSQNLGQNFLRRLFAGKRSSQALQSPSLIFFRPRITTARAKRIFLKRGVGPDGKPLPVPNKRRLFPKLYKCLVVNQDGSTYNIHTNYPYKIITLPLDLETLSKEEREEREKRKRLEEKPVYYSEEDNLDEEEANWDHSQYKELYR